MPCPIRGYKYPVQKMGLQLSAAPSNAGESCFAVRHISGIFTDIQTFCRRSEDSRMLRVRAHHIVSGRVVFQERECLFADSRRLLRSGCVGRCQSH